MNQLREDVHIHSTPDMIFGRLRAPDEGEWFARAFGEPGSNGSGLSYDLRLPLRRERARLSTTAEQVPTLLVMERDDDEAPLVSLSWALHPEADGEVHVTVDVQYQPAGGLFGTLLEQLLYDGLRRQAYRDALWRLKHLVEDGE